MSKLSIASGTISMSDLRTHVGDTDSISLQNFRPDTGEHKKSGLESYSFNGYRYINSSTDWDYYHQVDTLQSATAVQGGGTVTTSYTRTDRIGQYGTIVNLDGSRNSNQTYKTGEYNHGDRLGKGNYPLGSNLGLTKRAAVQSAGSYTAWNDITDSKGNFLSSTRSKSDRHTINIIGPMTKQQRNNLNGTIPTSGAISMSDLYEYDNGVLGEWTVTVGDAGNVFFGRGYGISGTYAGVLLSSNVGSVSPSANIANIDGKLQSDGTQIKLAAIYQATSTANQYPLKIVLTAPLRNGAAGSISNTSGLSYSRFGAAFNHTGAGSTSTTGVWIRPDDIVGRDNYAYRTTDWNNNTNNSRHDDGHAGWILPTQGPSLLQARAENEGGNPTISNVRFTPNSAWRGKTVIIQAVRTRNSGGISGFSCSGAASGNFSGESNSHGGPIEKLIVLPSSGYIQFSASGSGSYTGTNRIVQINIFDPFYEGLIHDTSIFNKVYCNNTQVWDAVNDAHQKTGQPNEAVQCYQQSSLSYLRLNIPHDSGFVMPAAGGTFTLRIES